LCLEFIRLVAGMFPKYKPKVTDKKLIEIIQEFEKGTLSREDFYSFISDVYFESRKATEFRLNAVKKRKTRK